MIITREITLDLTFNEIKIVNIKQYTKDSYLLHVNLTDKGEPFHADKDRLHCYFKMETPDQKPIYIDGTINDDGSVDITIPEKACLAAGSGIAELEFTELKDETVFATMNFYINIIASSCDNDLITSSGDFSALHNALFAANKTYDWVMESAQNSAATAKEYAKSAQSYAIGGTDYRENEDIDCAKHYSAQAQLYCQLAQDAKDSLGIPLRPMGTRTFANLPALADIRIGDMYNISAQFTTNDNFAGGPGLTVPAGSNIYKTADNKWDVLTGSPVAGVKGNAEGSYRMGNVNLTPANIGAPSNEYMEEHFVPDYIKSGKFMARESGWYRIAEYNAWAAGGYNTNPGVSCIINVKRQYAHAAPEVHRIQLVCATGGAKFVNMSDYGNIYFTKIRVVWDSDAVKYYLEIFYNLSVANETIFAIEGGIGFYNEMWKISDGQIVPETPAGITVLAEGDISKQFSLNDLAKKDGSNASSTWENVTAGKAVRDSDGNVIADTYARKKWTFLGSVGYRGEKLVHDSDSKYYSEYSIAIYNSQNFNESRFLFEAFKSAHLNEPGCSIRHDLGSSDYVSVTISGNVLTFTNSTYNTYVKVYAR